VTEGHTSVPPASLAGDEGVTLSSPAQAPIHNDNAPADVPAGVSIFGQAGEVIVVDRPAPGQTVEIQAAAGQTYVLDFPASAAEVQLEGRDFVLAFDDDGDGTADSRVVFRDLLDVAESGDGPTFEIGGVDIDAELLAGHAVALAQEDEAPLDEVAAGPGATGGGASVYSENLGEVVDLLSAQGVIPPTALQFGLTDLEDQVTLLAEDEDTTTDPAFVDPVLIVGENVRDIDGQTEPHRVNFPSSDQDQGEILGNDGADVLIGDIGGHSLVNKVMNLALVLDTSNSMDQSIAFNGGTMSRIEALDLAVERALDALTGAAGATVRVHMVSFATTVKEAATFDIIVDGVVDAAELQAAKDFILAAGDDPLSVAQGYTNYEAGFASALDWFSDAANTLDNPDFNQTIFVSDGLPNRAFRGDSTTVGTPDTAQLALDHVLGNVDRPGTWKDDTVSEFHGLLGSFEGVAGSVNAIGINVDGSSLANLSQLDGDDADSIDEGEELEALLGNLSQGSKLAEVGGDVIVGAGGDDLIFGDALFTDLLAADEGVALPAGSGWSVIEALAGNGFFDQDPASTVEEEIIAFLRDPANIAAYDFGAESSGGGGRAGGNDLIDGGGGADLIFGQEGDDTIIGGTGDDTLFGGSGADSFTWGAETSAGEADLVADFETGPGGDVLDLSALLSGVGAGDDGDELDAWLQVSFDGTDTTIGIDANGDGSGFTDVTVTVQGIDLTGGIATQAGIIDSLLGDGSLQVA